jgi:hypothetical protein
VILTPDGHIKVVLLKVFGEMAHDAGDESGQAYLHFGRVLGGG